MQLMCRFAVVSRQGGVIEDFSKGSVAIGNMNKKSTPSKKSFIIVRTSSNNTGTRFNLIGNIEGISTRFLNQGQVTVSLKEPSCNIIITKADPKKLKAFISYYKKLSPVPASLEPPVCRINLNLCCQERYKLRMENIIGMNFNMDHFTGLKIRFCTLELAGDQVPIAGAIRNMKKLTTFRLEEILLRSSTFLEIESKELKQLHLYRCETPLPIVSLFKNDLCYKDSLVELRLEGNHWSHVPNGIFQFGNLLKLSLSDNRITHLPDKFTNLPKLQELDLSQNRLRCLPSSIFKMQNLLRLSLDFNDITKLPNISTNSSKLQQLSLCFNQLKRLPLSIFALQNLSELELDNNRITELPDMFTNLSKLQKLILSDNQLTHLPPSIFQIQNLSELELNGNFITELPDKFANFSKLRFLSITRNKLQYLPSSIFALHLKQLDIENNEFNLEIPPSFGSEMVVHSLKELSYRAILKHKMKVKEGMLPKRFLKDMENHHQCICGCKFVDGREVSFVLNLNDILSFTLFNRDIRHLRVPIRGKMCTSLKSCFLDRFTK